MIFFLTMRQLIMTSNEDYSECGPVGYLKTTITMLKRGPIDVS